MFLARISGIFTRGQQKVCVDEVIPEFICKIDDDTTFTMTTVALFSKLARVDGNINEKEIEGLRHIFLTSKKIDKIYIYFLESMRDSCSVKIYAEQIFKLYSNTSEILVELVDSLFQYATIDGPLNRFEMGMLRQIINALEIEEEKVIEIVKKCTRPKTNDHFTLLGINKGAKENEIKDAYYNQMRLYHPDRNPNLADEIIPYLHEYISAINDAYKEVKTELGYR